MTKSEESEFVRKTRETLEKAFASTEDERPQLIKELILAGEDPDGIREYLIGKLNDILKKRGMTFDDAEKMVREAKAKPWKSDRIRYTKAVRVRRVLEEDADPSFVEVLNEQFRRAFERARAERLTACDPEEEDA